MGFFDRFFSSKPPTQDKFASMAMAAIRKAGENQDLVYDREQFSFRAKDGHIGYLANCYQEYCAAARKDRAVVLQRWTRAWFDPLKAVPISLEDARPDILPSLNSRAFFELNALRMRVEEGKVVEWPYQIIGDHFALAVVYDLPQSRMSVSRDTLEEWGISFYQALEIAMANLTELQQPFLGPPEGDGVYLSVAKDSYDSTRLVLLDMIQKFQVKGMPIAMIPNRDTLVVAGSDDNKGLAAALGIAQEALEQPRFVSGVALCLEGDEWQPWLPPREHPHYWDFWSLNAMTVGQHYNEQKELLEKLHQQTGEDIFVASVSSAVNEETNERFTYCVWPRDVPTLLPKTDRILIAGEDQRPVMVEWERAKEVAWHLMESMDLYPVRYKVIQSPSTNELKEMGGRVL